MKNIKKCRIEKLTFNSEYFKCPNCDYAEPRLVKGDVSTTPCPKCGHTPLYRVR